MIAELVEGVAVHLGEVPAIEGVEVGRVATRRLDQRAVAIEMGDARRAGLSSAVSPFQTPNEPFRYTPPGRVAPEPASSASAVGRGGGGGRRRRRPRGRRVVRILDDERPGHRIGADGADDLVRPDVADRVGRGARSSAGASAQPRASKLPMRSARRSHVDAAEERGEQLLRDRSARPAISRSDVIVGGELRRELVRRPVGVDPDADDRARIVRAEPVGLAEDPGELAGLAVALDDEVVRPLQADRCPAPGRRRPRPLRPSRG